MRKFVLDTNILIYFLREHPLYTKIETENNLSAPDAVIIISVVTIAELFSIGIQSNWGSKRLEKLDKQLRKLVVIDINHNDKALIDAYINIDAYSQGKLKDKPSGLSARNMGKNDLWIAATAYTAKGTLITTDADFDHLNNNFLTVAKYNAKNAQ